MEDPYITPAGVTYERDALLDHINTNGCFDPITRLNFAFNNKLF